MPIAAGMSGLSYRRYLPYEFVGLVGWATIYVAIGLLARESWEAVTQVVGVGGAVLFMIVGVSVWRGLRRRAEGDPQAPAEAS